MDSNSEYTPGLSSSSCSLCLKILTSDNDTTDFEAVNMCSDCNFLVLEDLDSPMRDVYQWRSSGFRRTRYNSSAESIENLFPQQVSYVFNFAREHQDNVLEHDDHSVDADGGSRSLQCTSSSPTPSGSRRLRRVLSDTESDGIGPGIAESESNMRFGGHYRVVDGENESISYGWSSNASDDGSSLLGIENSAYEGSDVQTDTDIDPMHAGMYHWNSDDQEEDASGWEEAGSEETIFGGRSRQRSLSLTESTWSRLNNILSAESEDVVDGHELDELVDHLFDADGLRRGAPPAAASALNSLPRVVIRNHEQLDGMVCAICKDSLFVETIMNQLPCSHLYHPSCIIPWLSSRNTCPLCRYELPTDDQEYEDKKHRNREIQQSDMNGDGSSDVVNAASEAISTGGSRSGGPQGRWYSIAAAAAAAAPVISVVGIALLLWLGNPLTEPRRKSSVLKVFSSHRQPSNHRGRRRWNLL